MKRGPWFLALALASSGAVARESCDVSSDYDLTMSPAAISFQRTDGAPVKIVLQSGTLSVDGHAVALSTGDRQRVAEVEVQFRQLLPQVQAIALDAVDLVFVALGEVARNLSNHPQETIDKLRVARTRILAELQRTPDTFFNREENHDAVGYAIAEFVPSFVGDIVSGALTAAFSGDEQRANALEARANRLEKDIQAKVETRAKALEARADALCPQVRRIDAIENKIEYRLPNGSRLELLRAGR